MHPPRVARVSALSGALVVLTSVSALAAPSPKEKADARTLAAEARKAVKDKRWKDALGAFKKADALDPSDVFDLEYAEAEVACGQLVEAARRLEAITAGTDPGAAAKKARETAKTELDALRSRIPTVRVTVLGPAASKVGVIVDGVDVDASGDVPVNPGDHTVGASADGWNPAEKDVKLAEGAREKVELTLTSGTTTAAAPRETRGSRVPGIVVASAGGAVLALGGLFGGLAFSATSAAKAQCAGNACPGSAAADISRSKTFGNVSTAMFIAGGAAAAAGVVLIIVAPGGATTDTKAARVTRVTPWLGAGQAGIVGSF